MDEQVVAVQEIVRQILSGIGIRKVVSVDDFYAVADSHYEDAVTLFQVARSKQEGEYSNLIPRDILDAPENIWTRRLQTFWSEAMPDARLAILGELAAATEYENLPGDVRDLSLLKGLIPKDMFAAMGPDDWDRNRENIVKEAQSDQRVLCLFDQDLHLANRTESAGITLLHQTLGMRGARHVICGLLSQTLRKDEELDTAREFAGQMGLRLDQFLPLSKDRLRDDPMEFADGLKMTVLNYAREQLSKQVRDIGAQANEEAQQRINNIDVYDFEHIVLRSSEGEGVWEPDTLFRLFDLFRYNAFREEALTSERRKSLYGDIERMRAIRDIETQDSQQDYPTDQVHQIQQDELFDAAELLNPAHQPLELGDIFQIGEMKYYILLAQPCDLMIRSKPMGKRSIDTVTLVQIQTYTQTQDYPNQISSFPLKYFADQPGQEAFAKFRNSLQVSLNVLDLAVFNDSGICRISVSDADASKFPTLHAPWRTRFEKLLRHYKKTHREFVKIPYHQASNYQKAVLRYALLCSDKKIDLNYDVNDGIFEFGIRRVKRCRNPVSIQLLSAYFSFLSRNPQEHHFARRQS